MYLVIITLLEISPQLNVIIEALRYLKKIPLTPLIPFLIRK